MPRKGKFGELPEEVKSQVEALKNEWETMINDRTLKWAKKLQQLTRAQQPGLEWGEPVTPPFFPWWDLLVAGPYQVSIPVVGPFKPSKIIAAGETAFMLVGLWRNPAPIPMTGIAPATLMGGQDYTLNFELMNVSTVDNVMFPSITETFQPFPTQFFTVLPPIALTLDNPSGQGHPDIYELNVTCDLTGPGNLPMAAFGSWVYDYDTEPAFLSQPGVPPGWYHERPIRFMVYTK
jgi:hypothetical protein